jgi:bifunctional lysine-specific demethylase and histidyl-hydroxylase NO66
LCKWSLPALHRTWAPLGLLCDNLQARLGHVPHANVYITPGNAAGFTPHYDVHEVFVLQVAGKKRWTLYEPPIELAYGARQRRARGVRAASA